MIKEIMFKWQDLEAKYMDKSWQYAEGEERGLEKGRAEGRAEGKSRRYLQFDLSFVVS